MRLGVASITWILLIYIGCTDWNLERVSFTSIITVDAIEIGASSAFLLGDIDGLRNAKVVESGFIVSSSVNEPSLLTFDLSDVLVFVSPEIDTITDDRAFAARATGLGGSTDYFFRAYVILDGEEDVAYGNVDQFTTTELSISLESISRRNEGCPTTAVIDVSAFGLGRGSDDQIGLVYSTDQNVVSPDLTNGQLVFPETSNGSASFTFNINVLCAETYFLRVVINPNSPQPSYPVEFAFSLEPGGTWINRSNFVGAPRRGKPVSFDFNARGYMGGGLSWGSPNTSDLSYYSPSDDSWTFLGQYDLLNISDAVALKFEDNVYIATGGTSLSVCNKEGNIDYATAGGQGTGPTDITWSDLCFNCPGSDCTVCGTEKYPPETTDPWEGIHYNCLCHFKGALEFSPGAQTLGFIDLNILGERLNALSIQIGNQGYVIGGQFREQVLSDANVDNRIFCRNYRRDCLNSTIRFDPSGSQPMDDFPNRRFKTIGFSIKDLGYAGFGTDCIQSLLEGENGGEVEDPIVARDEAPQLYDLYSFQPNATPGNQWKEVAKLPLSNPRKEAVTGFSLNDNGYVLFKEDEVRRVLWRFNPNVGELGEWTEIRQLVPNLENTNPYHLFTIGHKAFFYFPVASQNFWMYVAELN